jgi:hypothetical protein
MTPETKLRMLQARLAGAREGVAELRRKELEYLSLVRIQVWARVHIPSALCLIRCCIHAMPGRGDRCSNSAHGARYLIGSMSAIACIGDCCCPMTWMHQADQVVKGGCCGDAYMYEADQGVKGGSCGAAGDEQALPGLRHGHPEGGGM